MPNNYAIVVLSFNHPDLTSKTVDSVLLKKDISIPVYLIHNGSDPKNVSLLQIKYPSVKHLILTVNKGYSGGANFGLSEIFKIEKNILFLTNDTEVLNLSDEFPPALDFFSITILKRNSSLVDSVLGTINLSSGRLQHLKSRSQIVNFENNIRPYIPGTAFGITKNAFSQVSGFDESLHTYWEDVEFSLRAFKTANLNCGYCDSFSVKHKIGKTCHKHRFYTLYLFQRNRRWIMKKFGLSKRKFLLYYCYDMTKLLFKILKAKNRRTHLLLFWKAIND